MNEKVELSQVQSSAFPVIFTEKARDMAKMALEETNGEDGDKLRVSIKGGGCAGFQYALNFVHDVDGLDLITENDGLKIVCDIFSLSLLNGVEIDYVESIAESGFKFNNPNAKTTCGCGSSFS